MTLSHGQGIIVILQSAEVTQLLRRWENLKELYRTNRDETLKMFFMSDFPKHMNRSPSILPQRILNQIETTEVYRLVKHDQYILKKIRERLTFSLESEVSSIFH